MGLLRIASIFVITLLTSSVQAEVVAAQLSTAELTTLTTSSKINAMINSGNLQSALWLLRESGKLSEAAKLESHIRYVLTKGEVLSIGRTPDMVAMVANFEGGFQAVIKPEVQHSHPYNEVLTYELDRLLEFDLVPITVLREYRGRMMSFQSFVKNAEIGNIDFRVKPYEDDQLYTLDYLTEQIDRHGSNWLKTPNKRIIAIDNSVIFGHSLSNDFKIKQLERTVLKPARPVHFVIVRKLEELKKSGKIRSIFPSTARLTTISPQIIEMKMNELIEASSPCIRPLTEKSVQQKNSN